MKIANIAVTFKLLNTIKNAFALAAADENGDGIEIDTEQVLTHIKDGADLDIWDGVNNSPLLHTLVAGTVIDGYSPFNALEIVQVFLENGASVLAVDLQGNNFFHALSTAAPETLNLLKFIKPDDINQGLQAKNKAGLLAWECYARWVPYYEDIHAFHQLMPKAHMEEYQFERLQQISKMIYGEEFNKRIRYLHQESQNEPQAKNLQTYPENIRLFIYALRSNLPQIVQAYQGVIDIHQPFERATLLQRAAQNGDRELTLALLNLDEKKTGKKMLQNTRYADLSISFFGNDRSEDESINEIAPQVARIQI